MEITYSLEEINQVAEKILKQASSRTFIFYGQLGAGKTTLIQSLARKLGVKDRLASPTFSLVNEYTNEKDELLLHFDLYRLENVEEAYDIGIDEYLSSDAWIFIEWPDKIVPLLSDDYQKIEIIRQDSGQRLLTISSPLF